MKNKQVLIEDWGLTNYQQAWDRQEVIFNHIIQQKLANKGGSTLNYLIFTEHDHVYTLGKSGKLENLLLNKKQLRINKASFHETNRGGDITYHGPGQLVAYPILNLDNFFTDIHLYIRTLEEVIIRVLGDYKIEGERYKGYSGVWLGVGTPQARKICAIGVRCSRWVTMHGLALNVNTDLSYFNYIIPCGITGKAVTSLKEELGFSPAMEEVKERVKKHMAFMFEMEFT